MKKVCLALLTFVTILSISSCKKTKEKVDELTEFDMDYTYNQTIPSSSVSVTYTAPVNFTTSDINTNSSSTFSSKNTASNKVSEIALTKFKVSTTGSNLDYLKSLTIYIQASGQPEVQIATKTNIPTGVTSFDMDLSGTNLKEYFFGSTFKLKIGVMIDANLPTSSETLKLDQTLHVKATLLN